MDNSISSLLEKLFATWSLEKNLCIVKTGKSKPAMPNLSTPCRLGSKKINCTFSSSRFDEITWLTVCIVKNKLYGRLCLLLSSDLCLEQTRVFRSHSFVLCYAKAWGQQKHIDAFFSLKIFGCQRIDTDFSSQRLAEVSHHNKMSEQVEKFRELLCFLARQELPFRGHDESVTSFNRGSYIELSEYTRG